MRPTIPALAALTLTLALTGCEGGQTDTPDDTASSTESASPGPSGDHPVVEEHDGTISPTTPAPEPSPAPSEPAPAEAAPMAPPAAPLQPVAPPVVPAPQPPLDGGYTQGQAPPTDQQYIQPPAPAPAPPRSPADADPNDPSTWQGVDENGNDWAVIGPPPPGV